MPEVKAPKVKPAIEPEAGHPAYEEDVYVQHPRLVWAGLSALGAIIAACIVWLVRDMVTKL